MHKLSGEKMRAWIKLFLWVLHFKTQENAEADECPPKPSFLSVSSVRKRCCVHMACPLCDPLPYSSSSIHKCKTKIATEYPPISLGIHPIPVWTSNRFGNVSILVQQRIFTYFNRSTNRSWNHNSAKFFMFSILLICSKNFSKSSCFLPLEQCFFLVHC